MVVGDGMIARAFSGFRDRNDVVIFASGVSNSNAANPDAYQRETDLLTQFLGQSGTFVYFSTVSIHYPCLQESLYVRHKLHIEQMIRERCEQFLIFRLPNLVGQTRNPHTLTNFLYSHIASGSPFEVHLNASRYLLDTEHMVRLCKYILAQMPSRMIYEIVFNNSAPILKIVQDMERVLNKTGNYILVEKGCHIDIPSIDPQLIARSGLQIPSMELYNQMVLQKYYSRQVQETPPETTL